MRRARIHQRVWCRVVASGAMCIFLVLTCVSREKIDHSFDFERHKYMCSQRDVDAGLPPREHNQANFTRAAAKPLKGCILSLDSRIYNLSIPKGEDLDGFEERGHKLPVFLASKVINQAYAKKHGYQFFYSDGCKYIDSGRHPSWYKVKFIMEMLDCCCPWAFFLDSDSYMRMEDHTLSIESWILGIQNSPKNAAAAALGTNQSLFPLSPATLLNPSVPAEDSLLALLPRNGDGKSGTREPRHAQFLNPETDYVNAGVMIWKNTSLAMQALAGWWEDTPKIYHRVFPWEQRYLNGGVYPKYQKHIAVVPYSELTGPKGRLVRHSWSSEGEEKRRMALQSALLSIIAKYGVEGT